MLRAGQKMHVSEPWAVVPQLHGDCSQCGGEVPQGWVNTPQLLHSASQHSLSKPLHSFSRAPVTNDHKPGGLKTTQMYSLTILEARSLKSCVITAMLPPKALGENPPSPLPGFWQPLHASLYSSIARHQPLPLSSRDLPPCVPSVSLCPSLSLLYHVKTSAIGFRAHSNSV